MAEIFVPLGFFGFLITMAVLKHQRAMAEIQLKSGQPLSQGSSAELQEISRQLHELRDTTTRYDMSFDAALQRLESRVANLETKQIQPSEEFTRIGRSE
jgi:hypothetical protein